MVKVTMNGYSGTDPIVYYLDATLSQATGWVNRAVAGGQACVIGYTDTNKTTQVTINLANVISLQEV